MLAGWTLWFWLGVEKETPEAELARLQLTRDSHLADLHEEREACRAMAIALASMPADTRDTSVSLCWEGFKLSAESVQPVLSSLDKRITGLKHELAK